MADEAQRPVQSPEGSEHGGREQPLTSDRLAYKPVDAARVLGVSRKTIHRWLDRGVIRSLKEGGCRLIPRHELERVLGRAKWGH